MNHLTRIWQSKDLRKKIIFTIFIIFVMRVAAHITVPGVDPAVLKDAFGSDSGSAMSIFSALTGGSLKNFSIIMMGVSPYINASIIIQMMTVAIPKLEALSKEGESGRKKISSMTRWLTFPLAFVQSYGMIVLIKQSARGVEGAFIDPTNMAEVLPAMFTISAGTLLLVWLGELITEKGIGNGISIIIFAGIVSSMPAVIGNLLINAELGATEKIPAFLFFALVTILLLVAIVVVTDAHRVIQITHTSRSSKGEKSVFPIRVMQAGMIPIIFAVSMITFPSILAQFLQNTDIGWVQGLAGFWALHFNSGNPTFEYLALYFLLILGFSYFYVSITFNTENVAEDLQSRGGFIAGVRPGKETAEYLHKVSNRMNLWGGTFLGFVALVPLVFTMFTDLSSADLIISGSGLIIVVGVVLELINQANAQLLTHDYEKLV